MTKAAICKPALRLITLLSAVMLLSDPGRATTAVMLTDKGLITSSRLILSGDVRSIATRRDPDNQVIYTYVKMQASGVLKGDVRGDHLVRKQPGGTAGEGSTVTFGAPRALPSHREDRAKCRRP
jgi:hypothetical protein